MSRALITETHLTAIANAIRGKNGSSDTYTPPQMAAAIQAIPTGITPTGTTQITQNGNHDVTQYANANVQVPNTYGSGDEGKVVQNDALVAQTSRNIAANGTYNTTTNDEVVVSVQPNLQSKTVNQNGTVTPDQGYDGLSSVVVNVSGGGGGSGLILGVGNVTASSEYSSYVAGRAPGNTVNNMWGASGAGSAWWQIEFFTAVAIKTVKFAPFINNAGAIFWSATVALKGSNDLSTWDDLLTLSDMPQSNDQLTYNLNNTTEYKYYRFTCQSGSTYYTGLGKIQMYT